MVPQFQYRPIEPSLEGVLRLKGKFLLRTFSCR